MIKFLSKTYSILIVGIIVLLPFISATWAPLAHAQTDQNVVTYVPLANVEGLNDPIPGTTDKINVGDYIGNIVVFAIRIAGALAVIEIVIGGAKYVSSDAISGKAEGKKNIQNALLGLLLAIGAWVLLNTINPKTLNLNLSIPGIPNSGRVAPPSTPPISNPGCPVPSLCPPATSTPSNPVTGGFNGGAWPASVVGISSLPDATLRARFLTYPTPISVNKSNCTRIGQQACTSLDGLSNGAISGLLFLSTEAKRLGKNVSITITGGTEYWLHGTGRTDRTKNASTQHYPGEGAVDLAKSPALDALIQSYPPISGGCASGRAYSINGRVYVNETTSAMSTGAHWHVCYGP